MWIFNLWQKIDLADFFFFSFSKNICKLSDSSLVAFLLYYSLVCREIAKDMRLPDSSELLQSPTASRDLGQREQRSRTTASDFLYPGKSRNVSDRMLLCHPILFRWEKVLQLVQSRHPFDNPLVLYHSLFKLIFIQT